MGKKLAIKGHPTRGKEVIELLEMIGGNNSLSDTGLRLSGTEYCCVYYIGTKGSIIYSHHSIVNDDFIVFTLEEFLEKYPFKVGELKDLVYDHISCVITEMRWNELDECMEYHAEFGSNDYGWYRACKFCNNYRIEELNTVISGIYLNSCDYADEVELNLGDYEIEVRDGRTFAVKKKPKYPKTFEECLNMLYCKSVLRTIIGHKAELLLNLEMLLICRDAYWKIAGEQMGLDSPWKPDWKNTSQIKHSIWFDIDGICIKSNRLSYAIQHILSFPTTEMRDAFYENFKDLIEQCKELL